jgi:hypothetical protein
MDEVGVRATVMVRGVADIAGVGSLPEGESAKRYSMSEKLEIETFERRAEQCLQVIEQDRWVRDQEQGARLDCVSAIPNPVS